MGQRTDYTSEWGIRFLTALCTQFLRTKFKQKQIVEELFGEGIRPKIVARFIDSCHVGMVATRVGLYFTIFVPFFPSIEYTTALRNMTNDELQRSRLQTDTSVSLKVRTMKMECTCMRSRMSNYSMDRAASDL